MKRRVISLLRVSTDAQDLARQRTDVARVIAAYGLEVVRTIELDGVSGRKVQADPQFRQLCADLRRIDITGVCISALDRLFRPDFYSDFSVLDFFRESKKLIFSSKEGVLDPASDSGFLMSLMSGAQAGMEWRELRRRTLQGKAEKRRDGLHIDGGSQTLPRGVEFIPQKNKLGRITGGTWQYTEPDASRIRQAYDLLFERLGWHAIAERIGGGFKFRALSYTLRNAIWRGARVFPSPDGPFELQVIAEPLISPERWHAAQALMAVKRTNWLTTRRKEPTPFLCLGLARCACGKPLYSKHKPAACYYACQSRHPGYGPSCGARTVRREALDSTVEKLFTTQLLDPAYLVPVIRLAIGQMVAVQPDQSRMREGLEARRRRILDNYEDGHITRLERDDKLRRLDTELARLQPAASPLAVNAERLARSVVQTFRDFGKLPFNARRDRLRAMVREVVVENHAITGVTLAGGFSPDHDGVKSCKPSKLLRSLRCRPPAWRLRRS
jgi:DNA invertase Pin-like site-specific DNA recombinase